MKNNLHGFSAIYHDSIEVLVLGTMPSDASLTAQQYYAHPRNAFWPIMAEIYGFSLSMEYPHRLQALLNANLGLWDVLGTCVRVGSLDSNIQKEGMQINDFAALFSVCKKLKLVALNGAKASDLFEKHVVKKGLLPAGISIIRLPSTSPAHAAMSFEMKLAIWSDAITFKK